MKKNVKALILSLIATLAIGSFAACDKKSNGSNSDVVSESVGSDVNSESQEENSGVEIEKEIGQGNEVFYHSFKVESNGKKEKLRLSENLAIDVEAGKIDFKAIADLEGTENDVKFIKAM